MFIIPVLIVAVTVIGAAFVFFLFVTRPKGEAKEKKGKKGKPKDELLREANKRLARDPRNPAALNALAKISFENQEWEKAYRTYEILADIPSPGEAVNMFEVNLNCAIAAKNLSLSDVSYKYLVVARSISPGNFDVNYQLGEFEFGRDNFEKAVQFFNNAVKANPESLEALRKLGLSFHKIDKFKEAMTFLRKELDLNPADKESLFTVAECYQKTDQNEQALRIYAHLRPDPNFGAEACLRSGMINLSMHQDAAAAEDFEIGLKHADVKKDVAIELHYQLGLGCLRQQDIDLALEHLTYVHTNDASYKDAATLIGKYHELNANRNLQIYILGKPAEYIALCRKIVLGYFPKARVKITKASMQANEWADIAAEIDTPKWSDIVMFRFIRTQGNIGEFVLRDFHAHIKEMKAGKGVCFTVGTYGDEARRFTEARLIELVDKPKLAATLNTIDSSVQKTATK
jgi:tetratricopeptide (TPR) repeat protein